MMAEPHWSLVKGTIFSDKPKLADFGPLVASFLGGCGKKRKHISIFYRNSRTHTHLVGGLTHDSILQPIWDDYPN
jgi:hypothetical protein